MTLTKEDVRVPLLRLAGLTVFAFLLHGYHLGVDDGEIYLPAARRLLNPHLYPYAPEFFLSHAKLSLFSHALAWAAQLTHLSMEWTILGWYVVTLFAVLTAAWLLASECFKSARAVWSSVLLFAAVLTMPATNTGLLLMDSDLTSRSFTTPLTLFALAFLLKKRSLAAGITIVLIGLFNLQMVAYLGFLAALIVLFEMKKTKPKKPVTAMASFALIIPSGFRLTAATGAYKEALYSRDYYFLSNWEWYHWLGMLGPLAILAWFWRGKIRNTQKSFATLSFAMLPFGLLSIAAAAALSSSHVFDMFVRLQPLRSFHLITLVMVLLLGGVLGEYLAAKRKWVVAALVAPAAAGLLFADLSTYPASPHIEWPSATSPNAWVNTLLWIRANTPQDAVFAVDSHYFVQPGVDEHGFRALSERSALADYYKDSGVVSLFPALAPEWKEMSEATKGLNQFSVADFKRLETEYPAVNWTVIHGNAPAGLQCPYVRNGYSVCRLPGLLTSQIAPTVATSVLGRRDLFCKNRTGT